jgi:hypothetical protein
VRAIFSNVAGVLSGLVGPTTTAAGARRPLESLLSARVEGTAEEGPQVRVKLGAGPGVNQHFGAPEWRIVLGVELFDRGTGRPDRSAGR